MRKVADIYLKQLTSDVYFLLSRKIIKIYYDIAWKHGSVTVKDFRKYEKLKYKQNKLKLDIHFLHNCKQLGVYQKFLTFKLLNVSNKDTLSSVGKRLLHSAINKNNKNFKMSQKNPVNLKLFLSKQLSIIDFCIFNRSIKFHNKKMLQK